MRYTKTFGERLRAAINHIDSSEAAFARYTKISPQHLSHLIHNVQKPSFRVLQRIVAGFNSDIDLEWFILDPKVSKEGLED